MIDSATGTLIDRPVRVVPRGRAHGVARAVLIGRVADVRIAAQVVDHAQRARSRPRGPGTRRSPRSRSASPSPAAARPARSAGPARPRKLCALVCGGDVVLHVGQLVGESAARRPCVELPLRCQRRGSGQRARPRRVVRIVGRRPDQDRHGQDQRAGACGGTTSRARPYAIEHDRAATATCSWAAPSRTAASARAAASACSTSATTAAATMPSRYMANSVSPCSRTSRPGSGRPG